MILDGDSRRIVVFFHRVFGDGSKAIAMRAKIYRQIPSELSMDFDLLTAAAVLYSLDLRERFRGLIIGPEAVGHPEHRESFFADPRHSLWEL
jgi:hypothetical protein